MIKDRWNHNIQYHRLILDAVPQGGRVLDVGCGEGTLAREMAAQAAQVVGLDRHDASLTLARSITDAANVNFLCADLMQHPFKSETFDAVISVATLHHLGTAAGLEVMRDLVRPGGIIAVIGLASSEYPDDLLWDISGVVLTRLFRLKRCYWEHPSPIKHNISDSYRRVQGIAEQILPGARFQRLVLWRFSLIWQKPLP